jgi:hypothetical protein
MSVHPEILQKGHLKTVDINMSVEAEDIVGNRQQAMTSEETAV